ncbi:MAG: DNA cytosine methyltransferase [Muribaculaceae bacterium]|nr:DNA cytosine methyltransferase [Muribaculaceae bacterium]
MEVVSFFAGCGGLDLGFAQAGFNVIWANEFDKDIHATYRYNHPNTELCGDNLYDVRLEDIPECDGFIGGPPCQSWSVGGKGMGLEDERGKLFLHYVRIIEKKKPKFFVIENVFGILTEKHLPVFLNFIDILRKSGYNVSYSQLNASEYKIPQDRRRVFMVGIREELDIKYNFPHPISNNITLRNAIGDLVFPPNYYGDGERVKENQCIPNHDVYSGHFDSRFMARNRVRAWNEISFTIQAQAKNCPLHPQAPKMKYVNPEKRIFEPGYEHLYRRLSVRECARIQSFPDSFRFIYDDVKAGYKMVGNAVPPRLAKYIALSLKEAFSEGPCKNNVLVAYYRDRKQLDKCIEKGIFYIRVSVKNDILSSSAILPSYLMLIKGKSKSLYRIENGIKPQFTDKATLSNMGFSPSHMYYWLLKIDRKIGDYPTYDPKWKNPRDRRPYFDYVDL